MSGNNGEAVARVGVEAGGDDDDSSGAFSETFSDEDPEKGEYAYQMMVVVPRKKGSGKDGMKFAVAYRADSMADVVRLHHRVTLGGFKILETDDPKPEEPVKDYSAYVFVLPDWEAPEQKEERKLYRKYLHGNRHGYWDIEVDDEFIDALLKICGKQSKAAGKDHVSPMPLIKMKDAMHPNQVLFVQHTAVLGAGVTKYHLDGEKQLSIDGKKIEYPE